MYSCVKIGGGGSGSRPANTATSKCLSCSGSSGAKILTGCLSSRSSTCWIPAVTTSVCCCTSSSSTAASPSSSGEDSSELESDDSASCEFVLSRVPALALGVTNVGPVCGVTGDSVCTDANSIGVSADVGSVPIVSDVGTVCIYRLSGFCRSVSNQ